MQRAANLPVPQSGILVSALGELRPNRSKTVQRRSAMNRCASLLRPTTSGSRERTAVPSPTSNNSRFSISTFHINGFQASRACSASCDMNPAMVSAGGANTSGMYLRDPLRSAHSISHMRRTQTIGHSHLRDSHHLGMPCQVVLMGHPVGRLCISQRHIGIPLLGPTSPKARFSASSSSCRSRRSANSP